MDFRDIREPFAVNGDRGQIDYAPTSQEISWLNGYTYLYGLKPDETSLSPYIEREKFNEIFYLTTSKMLDIERYAENIRDDLGNTENRLSDTIASLSANCVTLKTNQSISGTKTFTGALPRSPKNPTHQDELVRMGYLQSGAAGMLVTGQWANDYTQNHLAANVWRTNTSRKTIGVLINHPSVFKGSSFANLIVKSPVGVEKKICYAGYADDGSYTGTAFFLLNPSWSWKTTNGAYFSEYK